MAITLAVIIGCAVAGIFLWKKRRALSLILLSPLLLVFAFLGYVSYHSVYHTTPDSLRLTVHKENNKYVVDGEWKDRLDLYRFPSDFLVFYVPTNQQILNVTREQNKDYQHMDLKFLHTAIARWLETQLHRKEKPQIFDIETKQRFQFSFVLPDNVQPTDVKLYYIHAREEPMEALEYWRKKVELE
ncbi:hypothetical protein [Anoxybacteroides tepidamans]|uniref:hypothetical protein n=1 Tax=Anoxybacteroides tepidamans TaxID=265948 RepID=UPI0004868823|nr:hypothetical protein [Anoxybacillus tepidamans]